MTKHPITPEMIRRFVAIIAKTRSGKTYTIKGAIEEGLDANEQTVILDPTSAYYGLRLGADGHTPAYPNLLIIGGAYGDIPIVPTAEAAEALADVIFDHGVSCIIDLGDMVGELVEWATAFATRFYRRSNKAQPIRLVIDEAHEFCPKDAKVGSGKKVSAGDMQVAFRRLATGGGSRGIRLVALTQRPAKLHNDVLSSCDTIVAMRTTWPSDRKVIADVIAGSGDKEKEREVLGSLAGLKPGEGWIWDTDRGTVERVAFPAIKTYDSSATPTGKGAAAVKLAPVDRERIGRLLAEAGEKIKADDPAELRRRIAELEAGAAQPSASAIAEPDPAALTAAYRKGYWDGKGDLRATIRQVWLGVAKLRDGISAAVSEQCQFMMRHEDVALLFPEPEPMANGPYLHSALAAPKPPSIVTAQVSSPPKPSVPPSGGPNGSQQKILDALAWWRSVGGNHAPTREAVAFVAGMKPTGGYFERMVGQCKTSGWLDYPQPGSLSLTTSGAALATAPQISSAVEAVRALVNGSQIKIVDALHRARRAVDRPTLGKASGMDAEGGYFERMVGQLKTAGVVTYPAKGQVALADWVGGAA